MESEKIIIKEANNLELDIRTTTEEDVPLILEYIKKIADFEKLLDKVVTNEDILKKSLFGERPYAEALIAEVEGNPVGFIVFYHNFSTFLGKQGFYIEDIFVDLDWRGKGIGKAMFLYCAKLARERDCDRMEWVALKWNPACEFYEHFGAIPMDEWVTYRLTEDKIKETAKMLD